MLRNTSNTEDIGHGCLEHLDKRIIVSCRTTRVFNERHHYNNVGHQYVLDLDHKFVETGSVCHRVFTDAAQVEISRLTYFSLQNTSFTTTC